MFEIGWTEILVVGLVAIIVLKPKDIPEMARSAGAFLAKMRTMAGEFQGQFNDAMKDAKLDDVKKVIDEVRELKNLSPVQQAREALVKLADEANSVKSELQNVASSTTASITAATGAVTAGLSSVASQTQTSAGFATAEPARPLDLDPLAAPPAATLVEAIAPPTPPMVADLPAPPAPVVADAASAQPPKPPSAA